MLNTWPPTDFHTLDGTVMLRPVVILFLLLSRCSIVEILAAGGIPSVSETLKLLRHARVATSASNCR